MVIKVDYSVSPVYINTSTSPIYIVVDYGTGSGGGATTWGSITGTLSDQTDLQTALDDKVPYTGATGDVNLGEYELKAGQIEYDQTPTGTAGVAVTRWNDTVGTIETTLKGGNVVLRHGRDMFERVVNKTGIQLTKAAYQAVRISTAQGQRLGVALAQANNDNNSADTIGLAVETIDNNQEGYIYTFGEIDGLNTTGSLQGETWADGDVLYLSPTTAGSVTNIKPVAPQHLVLIGYVVYSHANNGKIYVKTSNGFELGELHDVDTTGATNGQVLKYNGTIWTTSSDTDTNIYNSDGTLSGDRTLTQSTYSLTFVGSTSTKFHSNGNLTIGGTTDYGQKAQISGNLFLTTGADRYLRIGSSTNFYYDLQTTGDDFQIIEGGTTPRLTLKYSNGNIGIGTVSPSASAKVQIDSNTSGFLLPRMTGSQVEAISTPSTGLMSYATNAGSGAVTSAGWWGYDGSAWTKINGGGSNIYTSDGTLTGNRTLTNSTYSLTFVGGIEEYSNAQIGLRLQGSATTKDIYFNLKNTNASGKDYALRSMTNAKFEILNYTDLVTIFSHDYTNNNYTLRTNSYIGNTNFNLGLASTINGLWLSNSTAVGNYAIAQSGSNTFINAPTSGGIYFRVNNSDKALLTTNGRLLVGTTTESTYLLDVAGTARVAGTLRQTQGGNNYIDIIANANGSAPYIDLFYSGTIATRINSYVAMGGSFSNGNGILFGDTSGNSLDIKAKRIFATDLIETKSNLYLSGASGNRIQFFEPGVAYRGNIGVQNGTSYIQVRTGSATNLTDGTLSTIFDDAGSVGIGGITSVNASARLQIDSSTKGFLPPRMTTTNKTSISSPVAGLIVFDTTLNKLCVYSGTAWETITSV